MPRTAENTPQYLTHGFDTRPEMQARFPEPGLQDLLWNNHEEPALIRLALEVQHAGILLADAEAKSVFPNTSGNVCYLRTVNLPKELFHIWKQVDLKGLRSQKIWMALR